PRYWEYRFPLLWRKCPPPPSPRRALQPTLRACKAQTPKPCRVFAPAARTDPTAGPHLVQLLALLRERKRDPFPGSNGNPLATCQRKRVFASRGRSAKPSTNPQSFCKRDSTYLTWFRRGHNAQRKGFVALPVKIWSHEAPFRQSGAPSSKNRVFLRRRWSARINSSSFRAKYPFAGMPNTLAAPEIPVTSK